MQISKIHQLFLTSIDFFGLIIGLVLTIFIIVLFIQFLKNIFSKKKTTHILEWEIHEISFSPIKFKKISKKPEVESAWNALMQMMTRVISNTFDDLGSEKAVLSSIFTLFKELRNNLTKYVAPNSASIILSILNKEIRPFLAKWDFHINKEKVLDNFDNPELPKFKLEFKNDYEKLVITIENKRYKNQLAEICNLDINIKNHTDKSRDVLNLRE